MKKLAAGFDGIKRMLMMAKSRSLKASLSGPSTWPGLQPHLRHQWRLPRRCLPQRRLRRRRPAPMATPVAGAVGDREIALRLGERDESRIDALAILTEREGQTTINVVARDASVTKSSSSMKELATPRQQCRPSCWGISMLPAAA